MNADLSPLDLLAADLTRDGWHRMPPACLRRETVDTFQVDPANRAAGVVQIRRPHPDGGMPLRIAVRSREGRFIVAENIDAADAVWLARRVLGWPVEAELVAGGVR